MTLSPNQLALISAERKLADARQILRFLSKWAATSKDRDTALRAWLQSRPDWIKEKMNASHG